VFGRHRTGRRSPLADFNVVWLGMSGAVVALLFAEGLYAANSGGWGVFGAEVLVGGAATFVGVLLGFLFGIPHSPVPRTADPGASGGSQSYGGNTNLEQVSDWLTKVLLGATLTQVGNIGSSASHLFQAEALMFANGQGAVAVAGAITVYLLILGFLLGWLLTRVFLGQILRYADQDLSNAIGLEAHALVMLGAAARTDNQKDATQLRQTAVTLLNQGERLRRRALGSDAPSPKPPAAGDEESLAKSEPGEPPN
jgi:hypothetical protein